jgi:hypothetical protein
MADHGPKLKFTLPRYGVTPHEHPSLVGPGGLVDAENWQYRDGRLRTRFGLEIHTTDDSDTTNLLTYNQSSVETDTTGFTALGTTPAVLSQKVGVARFRHYSLKVDVTAAGDGFETDAMAVPSTTGTYTISLYLKWVNSATIGVVDYKLRLVECDAGGSDIGYTEEDVAHHSDGSWVRHTVTREFTTGATIKIRLVSDTGAQEDYYVDGLMAELGSSASTWAPGAGTAGGSAPNDNWAFNGNLGQRPLGLMQFDYLNSSDIERRKVVCGTDLGWWLYEPESALWRNITKYEETSDCEYSVGSGPPAAPSVSGTYTGTDDRTYRIYMASGTTFDWGWMDEGDDDWTWEAYGVTITGAAQSLQRGVSITFPVTSGYSPTTAMDFTAQAATPLTGGASSQVVFRGYDFQGVTKVLGCNGSDRIMVYDCDDDHYEPIAPLSTNQPLAARCIATAAGRVLAGNFTYNGTTYFDSVIYSEHKTGDAYAAWEGASIIQLDDTPGDVVSMMEMGRLRVVVYKSDSIYVLTSQSSFYPFRSDLVAANIEGPCSPLSVVPLPDGSQVYLSRGGAVMMFDGGPPRSLGPHIHTYIRGVMDLKTSERNWGIYDDEHDELWFVFTAKGTAGSTIADAVQCRGVVIQGLMNPQGGFPLWPMYWSRASFDLSAGLQSTIERQLTLGELPALGTVTQTLGSLRNMATTRLFCGSDGQIYRQNGETDVGGGFHAKLETGITDLGQQDRNMVIKQIDHLLSPLGITPSATSSQDVSVRLRLNSGERHESVTSAKTVDVASDNPPLVTHHRVAGRSVSLLLDSDIEQAIVWGGSEATIATGSRGRR